MRIKTIAQTIGLCVPAATFTIMFFIHILSAFFNYEVIVQTNYYGEWLPELIVYIITVPCFIWVLSDWTKRVEKKEEVVYESVPF